MIHWTNESINQWMGELVSRWVNQSVNQWMGEWVSWWISESVKSMNGCISESVNQWGSESMNQWMNEWRKERTNEGRKEWMNERRKEGRNECMHGWMDGWVSHFFVEVLLHWGTSSLRCLFSLSSPWLLWWAAATQLALLQCLHLNSSLRTNCYNAFSNLQLQSRID